MSRPVLSRNNAVATAIEMLDRKGAASLTMRYGARADDAERMLQAMMDAGLSPAQARVSVRAAMVTITGFRYAQAQAEQTDEMPQADPPADEFPNLAAMVDSAVAGLDAQLQRGT